MSLVSVVIPTKDRYPYLIEILSIMTKFKSNLIEFIIGDNTIENLEFINFLKKINDKRIRYFHFKEKLSQSQNMNLTISKSKYEYITAIGDDDFVLEDIIDFVRTLKRKKIDVIKLVKPVYKWRSENYKGSLYVPSFSYNIVKKKSKTELNRVIENCGTNMNDNPSVYHGLVSRNLLDKIYRKFNSYCPGPSPDIANCVAILHTTKYFYIYDGPILVSGNAAKSMAGLGLRGKHYGDIASQKHLPNSLEMVWSNQIPYYWSGPTIWAQSVYSTLSKINHSYKLNYSYLYAFLLIYHPSKIYSFFKNLKKPSIKFSFFYFVIYLFFIRLRNFLFKGNDGSLILENISLVEAYNYLINNNK